jgi:serine/threonine protein kinase
VTTRSFDGELTELDAVREALGAEYEILQELGRGGMAIVYRGLERELAREVAIKVLPPSLAFDSSLVERFQREARTSAALEHPHIVPIYRVGRSGRISYFVMKLLRGRSLSDLLRERGQLGAADTRRMLLETASALGYAARRGVVHRDVKPDNIMIDDGRCMVADFGIARTATDAKLTATGMSVGTPRYMSPEQARAKELDGRSDLYSLGIVAYECLVGHTPFDGDDAFGILMDHINAPLPRPALATNEEWDLFEIVERMLAKRPEDRYQTADELIAALNAHPTAGPSDATVQRQAVPRDRTVTQPRQSHEAEHSGPRPSAALNAALEVGAQLLKQQRPRVEAGLKRLGAKRPDLGASAAAARAAITRQKPKWHAGLARLSATMTGVTGRLRAMDPRRLYVIAAVIVLCVGGYYAAHFATKHRSRCAVASTSTAAAGAAETADAETARPFSLLLDAVGTLGPGDDLDVYYDVCGLGSDVPFTTSMTVKRNGGGFRKLFGGGVGPVTATYDERARGEAARRHRTVDFDAMPAGSYTMELTVTDAAGRVRTKRTSFQVAED